MQLNASCVDGKIVLLASDKTWRHEISSSENLGETQYGDNGGEEVDARKDLADWNAVGFDDSRWPKAAETSVHAALSAQMMEATRIIETVKAIELSGSGPAYQVVFAKNFTGWLDIRMNGQAPGDVVTIKVANKPDGTGLRPKEPIRVQGPGRGGVSQPVQLLRRPLCHLEGLKAKPRLADVTGYAVATDLKRTGHFACSKELFNQIYETDLWTYRANTIEGYTCDCPHRERLGYGEESFANAWGVGLPNYQIGRLLYEAYSGLVGRAGGERLDPAHRAPGQPALWRSDVEQRRIEYNQGVLPHFWRPAPPGDHLSFRQAVAGVLGLQGTGRPVAKLRCTLGQIPGRLGRSRATAGAGRFSAGRVLQ